MSLQIIPYYSVYVSALPEESGKQDSIGPDLSRVHRKDSPRRMGEYCYNCLDYAIHLVCDTERTGQKMTLQNSPLCRAEIIFSNFRKKLDQISRDETVLLALSDLLTELGSVTMDDFPVLYRWLKPDDELIKSLYHNVVLYDPLIADLSMQEFTGYVKKLLVDYEDRCEGALDATLRILKPGTERTEIIKAFKEVTQIYGGLRNLTPSGFKSIIHRLIRKSPGDSVIVRCVQYILKQRCSGPDLPSHQKILETLLAFGCSFIMQSIETLAEYAARRSSLAIRITAVATINLLENVPQSTKEGLNIQTSSESEIMAKLFWCEIEAFNLSFSTWHPDSSFEEFADRLRVCGPHMVFGFFGPSLHKTMPVREEGHFAGRTVFQLPYGPSSSLGYHSACHFIVVVGAVASATGRFLYYLDPHFAGSPEREYVFKLPWLTFSTRLFPILIPPVTDAPTIYAVHRSEAAQRALQLSENTPSIPLQAESTTPSESPSSTRVPASPSGSATSSESPSSGQYSAISSFRKRSAIDVISV